MKQKQKQPKAVARIGYAHVYRGMMIWAGLHETDLGWGEKSIRVEIRPVPRRKARRKA